MVCFVQMCHGVEFVLVVRQNVSSDSVDPRSEGCSLLEGLGITKDSKENFLGQILTQRWLVGEVDEKPIDGPMMPVEK